MTSGATLLTATGLGRRYGEFDALDGVDVTLARGDALALLGPNGAGKTTLLTMLAGVDRPTSGTLDWGGASVGWVPHRPALYSRLTTRENLVLFADLEGAGDPAARADELIEHADLGEYADRRAARLSTGTLQRLNLCVALAGRPDALLLDEPTSTLSADQRIRLWDWLEGLRDELDVALLFSTQSVDEARRQATSLMVLVGGRAAFSGAPAELAPGAERDAETAEQAFLDLVDGGAPA